MSKPRPSANILPRPGPAQQVYNLEVNGEHVYYVGQQQLLVHNESCLKIVGLGKHPYYHELPPNAKLAINDGWTKAKLTSYASDSENFVPAFKETLNNADEIVFNLRGVNPREAGLITGSNPLTSLSM